MIYFPIPLDWPKEVDSRSQRLRDLVANGKWEQLDPAAQEEVIQEDLQALRAWVETQPVDRRIRNLKFGNL